MANCLLCEKSIGMLTRPRNGKLKDGYELCFSCTTNVMVYQKREIITFDKVEMLEIWSNLNAEKQYNLDVKNFEKSEQIRLVNDQKTAAKLKLESTSKIIVTTGDLKQNYEVIGPVYFQISNKGLFSNEIKRMGKIYQDEFNEMRKEGLTSKERMDWAFIYGEFSYGMQNDFDKAFYISVRELQRRGDVLGADAIISMKQDIDLDTTNFQYFYLQMYGTAVRFVEE
jgi:predicted RNA-binding protein with PIN domain